MIKYTKKLELKMTAMSSYVSTDHIFQQLIQSFSIKNIKNDESRYGDVTTLSVFSILYAFMV
jgi:hypothetical protein